MTYSNLAELYEYFDNMVEQEATDDQLFASSYIRGFVSLAASQYGGEEQALTKALANDITAQLNNAKKELTPADQTIVQNYWLELADAFDA